MAAFAVDTVGRRNYTVWFKDLKSGAMGPSTIEDVTANLVWAEGSRVLFYTDKDPETLRAHQIWRHDLVKGLMMYWSLRSWTRPSAVASRKPNPVSS